MDLKKGAVLSDCHSYRYRLWRIWNEEKAKVMFVMLNPSTADAKKDDPTIRRCVGFAKEWGYGGIYVGNLYAYRTSDRKVLNKVEDPVGPENKFHVRKMANICEKIICAWGFSQGPPPDWLRDIGNLFYLEQNKDGTPSHPLYLPKESTPIDYKLN